MGLYIWIPLSIVLFVAICVSVYSYDKRNTRRANQARAAAVLNTNNTVIYTVPTTRQIITMQHRQQAQQRQNASTTTTSLPSPHNPTTSTCSRPPSYNIESPMANPGGGCVSELPPTYDQAVVFSPPAQTRSTTTTR